jgi:type I restriction enzyme M protein
MALKKSQLYSSLWQSCDELRGGMDASQYKDYVLTLLFMKYVSDKYAGKPNALIEIPKGGSFADMVALKGDKEIGDKINKIIGKLAEANDLKGVIDQADFNDESKLGAGKEMQDRLSKLVAIFDGLDFHANRAEGDDLLGDAYEYLMRHFATQSGKSKGQFYTPAEVSRIMAQVIGLDRATAMDQPTVYDPTCGSGSLLIKAADQAATTNLAIYGQEMDVATWALARMNMILHGHPTAEIWRGNTLSAPHFKQDRSLQTFDFAVANPPFSAKAWSSGLDPAHDEFGRFELGVPPAKSGDYAFLLHLIKSLKSKGKGAIILPHGVLFRGSKEADIRKRLVTRGLIKGIIGLPANLFYGTGIPACIVVIDKEHAHVRTGIFMIDASKGFLKDGNKNRLRAQDIHKIVDVFNRQIELPRYSRMVPVVEIASPANDYNLNIPRYIDSSEAEDLQDLNAHLNGGIPNRDIDALGEYWSVFPSVRAALFKGSARPGYSDAILEASRVMPAILAHAECKAFSARVAAVFEAWRTAHEPQLKALKVNDLPKTVIHALSEDVLSRFAGLPLLDRYNVYQRLMDYWADVMQDDVYLIAADGWESGRVLRDADEKEIPDFSIKRGRKTKKYVGALIPGSLVIGRFFNDEQAEMERLEIKANELTERKDEFEEVHGVDDGALSGLEGSKGITKGNVQERVMELRQAIMDAYGTDTCQHNQAKAIKKTTFGSAEWKKGTPDEDALFEELDILYEYLQVADAAAAAKQLYRTAVDALYEKALARYGELTEPEIKTLVVVDKWLASLRTLLEGEAQRLNQEFAERVKELEERYAEPLPQLEQVSKTLRIKVEGHLKQMGFEWQ